MQLQSYPRRCVLIIDDDPVFTLLASETLEQAGFKAKVASNTQDALTSFEQEKPDLVLLDVELPGSNGFQLCATLRAMSPGVDVPIVMVTGHDDTESIAQAYQVGATDFIHKPVLWPTLPHRIGFILRAQDNIRALRVSEQKNRTLLQALPDTIFILVSSRSAEVRNSNLLKRECVHRPTARSSSLLGIPPSGAEQRRESSTLPTTTRSLAYRIASYLCAKWAVPFELPSEQGI